MHNKLECPNNDKGGRSCLCACSTSLHGQCHVAIFIFRAEKSRLCVQALSLESGVTGGHGAL